MYRLQTKITDHYFKFYGIISLSIYLEIIIYAKVYEQFRQNYR